MRKDVILTSGSVPVVPNDKRGETLPKTPDKAKRQP